MYTKDIQREQMYSSTLITILAHSPAVLSPLGKGPGTHCREGICCPCWSSNPVLQNCQPGCGAQTASHWDWVQLSNESDRQLAIGQSLRATLIVEWEVDGTEWSASRSGWLIPREGTPVPDGYATGRTSDLVWMLWRRQSNQDARNAEASGRAV